MSAQYLHPEAIVDTAWLAANLQDPALRVFDCTTYLRYETGTGRPYRVESGHADYLTGHIPGSAFLDLQGELSDSSAPTNFMMLPPEELASRFAAKGIGDGTRVVLYARKSPQWATRIWWMLRAIGFDNAAVLDGGFDKWAAEGRKLETAETHYPPAQLTARPRPGLFVGKAEMQAAIGDAAACSINALAPDLHRGENDRYGRPGRIPGSVNLPAAALTDPANLTFLPPEQVKQRFDAIGATPEKRILLYCGGGIAATLDAFLLHQLGYRNLAVYDASMSEWAKDSSLPIETG
ncbi:sulfurtransferase [Siccirubricoccus sp. KC 17139]|uniref:Sulfurtransferase n=1 Tax=Siccirubricoccus soli TaxID=2899147 RepID=A0ABT1D3S7_9PROT|nr:sulfurtransferase [Siccirubricoccus soli]MCO6416587.1 sulfurtransferase [Siccirubricoccus soli]MCP2682722.1 sulfurtransferase [Siccirubricoccus soli]